MFRPLAGGVLLGHGVTRRNALEAATEAIEKSNLKPKDIKALFVGNALGDFAEGQGMLPAYAAQSTAVVCGDVPAEIGDLYRLFLVLLGSAKPVVTGAFSPLGTAAMIVGRISSISAATVSVLLA